MSGMTAAKMEFAYLMAKHSNATMYDLQRLLRYGATHNRLMVEVCNVGDMNEERVWKVQARIREIVKGFGASVSLGGDPRGCTVKIVVPDGYTNDMGREGICVPTA